MYAYLYISMFLCFYVSYISAFPSFFVHFDITVIIFYISTSLYFEISVIISIFLYFDISIIISICIYGSIFPVCFYAPVVLHFYFLRIHMYMFGMSALLYYHIFIFLNLYVSVVSCLSRFLSLSLSFPLCKIILETLLINWTINQEPGRLIRTLVIKRLWPSQAQW